MCCSQLLRSVAAEGATLGEQIQPYLDCCSAGRSLSHTHMHARMHSNHDTTAVPDLLVLQVLENRLSQLDCSSRGWIIHGFPRNLDQARLLHKSQYQPNRYVSEVMWYFLSEG